MNWAMEKSILAAYTPTLRTEPVLRTVPVLRMAYFPKRAYDALFSKTLMLQSLRDLRWCGIKSGNLRVSRHLSGGLTRSCFVQFLSAAAGREEIGGGLASPPPCPLPKGDNPSVRCGGQLPLHRGAEGRSRQHFLVCKEVRAPLAQGSRRMKRRRRDGRSADSFRWTWWRRRGWICAGRRRGI